MSIHLNKLQSLKTDFELNIEASHQKPFSLTSQVFDNMKKAFKINSIALVALMGLSSHAAATEMQDVNAIQKVYEESLSISNIYYDKNLPEYFTIKDDAQAQKKDILMKNDFWQNNVTTLVSDMVDMDELNDNDKKYYAKQIAFLSPEGSQRGKAADAQFVAKYSDQEKVDNLYSGKNDYRYFFKADHNGPSIKMVTDNIPEANKKYVADFVTYHEMAHASYEQEISTINKHATFDLSTEIGQEMHSDVSSMLMVGKKHNLKASELQSFVEDMAIFRAKTRITNQDMSHNTSVVLIELRNFLANNPKAYNDLSVEKISSFSGYFVHNITHGFNKKINSHSLEKIDYDIDILSMKDKLKVIQTEFKATIAENPNASSHNYMSTEPQKIATYNEAFSVYIKRLPEQERTVAISILTNPSKDFADILRNSGKVVQLNADFVKSMSTFSDKDLDIYATTISKKLNNMDLFEYSNFVTLLVAEKDLSKLYTYNTVGDKIENNKEVLSNKYKIK